jgi:TM2 domain-containing membrane protein YozV
MSVDLNQLAAHLPTAQREAVKQAYHKQATNSTTVFLLCFFLGWCGAHRFYLGQAGKGFARLLVPLILVAVVVLGIALAWPASVIALVAIPLALIAIIWEILDLFRVDTEVHARNLKVAEELIANSLLADTSVEQAAANRLDSIVRQTYAESTGAAQPEQAAAASVEPAPASADAPAVEPAAAVSTEYVATTVNEISAEPDAARDAPPAAPSDVSTTESYTLGGATGEQVPGEAAAVGAAAAGAGALYTEVIAHEHSVSGYATTDSVETTRTTPAADAPGASAIPSWTEATAPTWPDHPPLEPETGDAFAGYYPAAPAGGLDLTDRAGVADAKPIADVGTAGALPLRVWLPAEAYPAAPAGDDDDLLVLLPDETPPAAASDAGVAALAYGPVSAQPQPEAYVPPTVPVVTIPPAEASVPPPEEEPTTAPYHAVPMSIPATDETPTVVPERESAHAELQPDFTLPAAAAADGALAAAAMQPEYHESHTAQVEAGHHQMRRIRVVRQVKVNDEVVEETSAEEFIEADADPEPVRARLQEMLRQQASGRMPAPGGEA